jgi:putative transposase
MQLSQEYPIVTLCQVLNYPRSQVYYQSQPPCDETEIQEAIVKRCGQHPTYGYRRITAMLQRQGHEINHKRVAAHAGVELGWEAARQAKTDDQQ